MARVEVAGEKRQSLGTGTVLGGTGSSPKPSLEVGPLDYRGEGLWKGFCLRLESGQLKAPVCAPAELARLLSKWFRRAMYGEEVEAPVFSNFERRREM